MNKLTPKQKAFADNYIQNGGNITAAAVSAGYSKKTAYVIGSEMFLCPVERVEMYFERNRLRNWLFRAAEHTRDYTLEQLRKVKKILEEKPQ